MTTHSSGLSVGNGRQFLAKPPVWDRLNSAATKHTQNLAVISVYQKPQLYQGYKSEGDGTCLRWSYATLNSAVNRLCYKLQDLGLQSSIPTAEAAHILKLLQPKLIFAHDLASAAKLDCIFVQNQLDVSMKVVAGASEDGKGWLSLSSLLSHHASSGDHAAKHQTTASSTSPVTILLTSGTTSFPKAVPHTDETLNAFSENLCLGGTSETNIFCSLLPNNHAIGYFFPLHYMMHGGCVVFPSPSFDAQKAILALENEKVSHTALVPAALHILSEFVKKSPNPSRSFLRDVCIAGSAIMPEDLVVITNDLRSAKVSTGFGMTEGSPIWSEPAESSDLICGRSTYAGHTAPGTSVKICAPGSKEPLPLGEEGELHQSGPGVVRGYLGDDEATDAAFYNDEKGRRWFITGDELVMHENGQFSITGRYKDIINKGGTKISPAAMEAIIRRCCLENAQVIGVPDAHGGEAPVVVCLDSTRVSEGAIRDAIVQEMGPKSSPIDIIQLSRIGLQDYPRSSAGKIQKAKLVSLYLETRNRLSRSENKNDEAAFLGASFYLDCLLRAYNKATGIDTTRLDLDRPASLFSDSIGTMRVRDYIRKTLRIEFSAQDMVEHDTIRSQALMIQARAADGPSMTTATSNKPVSSLQTDFSETWPTTGNCSSIQDSVARMVAAQGFNWPRDVSTVIPVSDYMQVLLNSHIIDSWNFAIAIQTTAPTLEILQRALCTALANNPILTSLYAATADEDGAYVILELSETLVEKCISTIPALASSSDLRQLAVNYPYKQHSTIPGPLFHAALTMINETNRASMVLYVHHMVQDATSMRTFLGDLDHALAWPDDKTQSHTDFKAWAEFLKAVRYSPLADLSVNYHVARLRNLHIHTKGLYPSAPLPRRAIEESPDGFDFGFDAPGLLNLKKRLPSISASTVVKAAMALVNVSRTKHTHALFYNFEAGRQAFAFAPSSLRALSPALREASDVNGPTMEGVCNLIEVNPKERTLELLDRVQKEQIDLTKHCHAPVQRILEILKDGGNGCHDIMMEVHRTQFLSWAPGFLGEHERLKVLQIAIRCAAGLVLVGSIGGSCGTEYLFSLRWDVANFSKEQTIRYIEDVKKTILLLTSEHLWSDNVGRLLGKLQN